MAHSGLNHEPTHGTPSRATTRPDPPAPDLLCPSCLRPLVYQQTVFGGVPTLPERWDMFVCYIDGPYEYRHRTKSLKPAVA